MKSYKNKLYSITKNYLFAYKNLKKSTTPKIRKSNHFTRQRNIKFLFWNTVHIFSWTCTTRALHLFPPCMYLEWSVFYVCLKASLAGGNCSWNFHRLQIANLDSEYKRGCFGILVSGNRYLVSITNEKKLVEKFWRTPQEFLVWQPALQPLTPLRSWIPSSSVGSLLVQLFRNTLSFTS